MQQNRIREECFMNMHLELLTKAHKREIDCIEKDRRSLKRRVAVLEHECKDMASEHTGVMNRMAAMGEDYSELHVKLSVVCTDMEALKDKTSRLLITHSELTDDKICLKEEIKSLRTANQNLTSHVDRLKTELKDKTSDVDALRMRVASLQQQHTVDEWIDAGSSSSATAPLT